MWFHYAVLVAIVLLECCQYIGQLTAGAIEMTGGLSVGCYQPNQYLHDYYTCKPNEFLTEVVCEGGELSIECPRSKKIVLFTASTMVSSGVCPRPTRGDTDGCSECIQQDALKQCQGSLECYKDVASNLFGNNCFSGHVALTYTCVSQAVLKRVRQDKEYVNDGGPCTNISTTSSLGHVTEITTSQQTGVRHVTQTPVRHVTQVTVRQVTVRLGRVADINSVTTASTGSIEDDVTSMSPYYADGIGILADWTWTALFIKANEERFIIYVLLSVSVGAIFVLLLVIFRLLQVHQRRTKSMSLPESVGTTGHVQTSTQTAETAALLSAQDGIQLLRYSRSGSREDTPDSGPTLSPLRTAPVETTYYPATASQASTLMTPDRSDPSEYPGFRSLGRSYNNPYRHDSYRTDGYRTISK